MFQKTHITPFYLLLGLILICTFHTSAQTCSVLGQKDYFLDSTKVKELAVVVDHISFFKDNEYTGPALKGYSLPGFWLELKGEYQPLKNLKLELGAHGLVYSGAYKYPSYAYHDIAKWKGDQYQKGTHILPYFKAHLQLKSWQFVFGNIYNGMTHKLIAPLYNPELDLTTDPESGFQIIRDTPHFHFDTWINWQSFIFDLDSHQEAFTVGLSSEYRFNQPTAPVHFYMPFQVTIQHRGGEQDTITTNSVQTLSNGALGFGVKWNLNRKVVKEVNIEADALMHYQQAGKLWQKDTGFAGYAKASVKFSNGIYAETGYLLGKDFNTLFGIPYYGSVSLRNEGTFFKRPQTLFFSIDYSYKFAKRYAFGAKADLYYHCPKGIYNMTGKLPSTSSTSFSFGVFLRATPRFLIKKFK